MEQLWLQALIWFTLVLISSLISFRFAISAALIELIVGIVAGNTIHPEVTPWVNFLASFGAVILTFLAGAELESEVIKAYWKESLVLGFISFFAPFLGGVACYPVPSWLGLKAGSACGGRPIYYLSCRCLCGDDREWA